MRLIDAHEVLESIHSEMKSKNIPEEYFKGINYVIYLINTSHNIDAAQIIKCKNCKFNKTKYCMMTYYSNGSKNPKWNNSDDDYCSYGERE